MISVGAGMWVKPHTDFNVGAEMDVDKNWVWP